MSFPEEASSFRKKDLIEVVDIEGNVLKVCHHLEAFEKHSLVRCAQVIVFNDSGELLLEFRRPDRRFFPGCWNASSAGFVAVGECPKHAAEREVKEELGVEVEAHFVEKFIIKEANDHTIDYFFIAHHNGPFECNEAECLKFFKPEEISALKVTPHLREQLRILKERGILGIGKQILAQNVKNTQT